MPMVLSWRVAARVRLLLVLLLVSIRPVKRRAKLSTCSRKSSPPDGSGSSPADA
jgi:hypothetical protein